MSSAWHVKYPCPEQAETCELGRHDIEDNHYEVHWEFEDGLRRFLTLVEDNEWAELHWSS